MPILSAFLCGLVFGVGLVISGMTDTTRVLGFLDVLAIPKGAWDPTLVIVMVTALAVSMPGFVLARRRSRPLLAGAAAWPTRRDIDKPLLAGAALFGTGWGLVGLCPGPAIVNLATASPTVIQFVAAMIGGMLAHDFWRRGNAWRRSEAASAVDG
jgi:uncharacterized membrane protein YedE/YeeE